MRYQVLGPIRVVSHDREFLANARKIELLLAVLVARANEVVSVGQLIAELWDEDPPRRAKAALHVYVSQLRKLLVSSRNSGAGIVTRAPGYLLVQGGDEIDVQDFQRFVGLGRHFLDRAEAHAAERELSAALSLWRGPVFGDVVGDGPIVRGFAAWAEEARHECLELHLEALLALGQHRQVVGPLYQLISQHPLRESFYWQLMLALYRSDRQADALAVFQAAQRALDTELGVQPCRALQELHRTILLGEQLTGQRVQRV
ncbi:AfsR/SARP family transcriptional regulator [Pseudofrankia inefficax]|uniref:Transcriptional regulator, SARP family n=1 Tax=Pseudofrankia inefficax (strain DSM 45817 / CECT 9037 / DDB 130130 / EuI1c) TaxID=298654 RepID=E3JAP5_PSEI1|nr:AfsR/SARP family transcriptional regulator [Pseudofrankia inefficax]ADP82237.1 transcriptional regulator, SARP family [Pseudofrankia inefficax]